MQVTTILDDLRRAGIEPQVEGGNIIVPAGVLTEEQRHAIRANKSEVIALLTGGTHRFVSKGMAQHRAERIIKMLAARDATLDDRRSCAECASYYAGRCMKRMQPVGHCDDIADVLHRCAGFSE